MVLRLKKKLMGVGKRVAIYLKQLKLVVNRSVLFKPHRNSRFSKVSMTYLTMWLITTTKMSLFH